MIDAKSLGIFRSEYRNVRWGGESLPSWNELLKTINNDEDEGDMGIARNLHSAIRPAIMYVLYCTYDYYVKS